MSGDIAGHSSGFDTLLAVVPENVSILTASRPSQRAAELVDRGIGRGGLFTSQLIGGLRGAAADLLGDVSVPSLFAHASTGLQSTIEAHGWPTQQAMFKANTDRRVVLRRAEPRIREEVLARLPETFKTPDAKVVLTMKHEGLSERRYKRLSESWQGPGPVVDNNPNSPTFGANYRGDVTREPFSGTVEQRHNDYLKAYRDGGLVVTSGGRDFYWLMSARRRSDKLVWLNELGQYFWHLAYLGRFRKDI